MTKPVVEAKANWEDSRLSKYLRKRFEEIASRKSQRQVATELGYDKPNVLSMYKRGAAKFPLEKIPALAKSIEADPGFLLKLSLEQTFGGQKSVIEEIFGSVTSQNNRAWIKALEEIFEQDDPDCTQERIQLIRAAVAKREATAA